MTEEVARAKTMQLATEKGGQPWVCTVYFVLYAGNFYWLSYPERRHSQELAENPRVGIAIQLKTGLPVIGLQAEGDAAVVDGLAEIEAVLARYVAKYGSGERFVQRYKEGKNRHALYRFAPRRVVLFDEQNYPENSQHEIQLDN